MKNINSEQSFGINGLHRLSICDTRDPKASQLEREILAFQEAQTQKIAGARKNVSKAIWRGFEAEAGQWRTIMRMLKNEKHATLAQMYEAMRGLTLVSDVQVHNIIPTAGRSVIARWIIGDNTYDADDGANYGSLGTSSTAPANGNTTLGTETYRKARSSEAQSSNVATLSNFYTASEVTGTFEEAGWHIDATGSANTGQLLSRFLTGTIAKSSTESLIVESTLTIS